MTLQQQDLLFIDCQTTGMHPSLGEMLELSWTFGNLQSKSEIKSRLLKVPLLPRRVEEVTGVTESMLEDALDPQVVREEFLSDLEKFRPTTALIHYAQFERAFLLSFFSVEKLPFEILCSHAISKRVIPNVPSQNIRALSGYFGSHFSELKRSADHLRATIEIWKGLVPELERQNLFSVSDIRQWLQTVKAKKPQKFEYNIDREWRLKLPNQPGIYRMFSKSGEILYVGKATSLKDRVNSYFRGKRGREKRKLEMMAQAWRIEVMECESVLEAAVLESDEIKKHNPPYNVALKPSRKSLVYFSRDFSSRASCVDSWHPIGPFRELSAIDELSTICRWRRDGDARGVFYNQLSLNEIQSGFEVFVKRWPSASKGTEVRSHLALAFKILRAQKLTVDDSDIDSNPAPVVSSETEISSPDEVADKFERAYMRAAQALLRSRRMTRLINCDLKWREDNNWKNLQVRNARIEFNTIREALGPQNFDNDQQINTHFEPRAVHTAFSTHAWKELDVADFDRISVLCTEISKNVHVVGKIEDRQMDS